MAGKKTVIVTGSSQGIGAAVVQAFWGRGYNVVATSRSVSKAGFAPSPNLVLVDGDIGQAATAENGITCCQGSHQLERKSNFQHVVVMKCENGKVAREHVWWDQASLLVQVGLLDPANLPVVGIEQAKQLLRVAQRREDQSTDATNG